jgi:Ribbon-helix-helix protein, copG family
MSSGPNIPDAQRNRPRLGNLTVAPEVKAALDEHCDRSGETKSAVVERALRVELGMPEEKEEEENP